MKGYRGLWNYVWFRMLVTKFVNSVAIFATQRGIPFYISTWYAINDGFTPAHIKEMSAQYLEYRNYKEEEE